MPAHKKYLYTVIEHTGKILVDKASRTEAQKLTGIGNISATIYNRSKCSPDTPHPFYIALYDLDGNLVYMPKILPYKEPEKKEKPKPIKPKGVERKDCIHHDGCECQALIKTFCKIEDKRCRFYKPRKEAVQNGAQ